MALSCRRLAFCLAACIAGGLTIISCAPGQGIVPKAISGVLDAENHPLTGDSILPLDGEWEFYWGKFLTSEAFTSVSHIPDAYVEVPGTWNKLDLGKGELGAYGYATYRLIIRLGDHSKRLALKFLETATAAAVYINGELLGRSGTAGTSQETSVPAYIPQLIRFEASGGEIEIILHVSNFNHRTGGARKEFVIGTAAYLSRNQIRRLFTDSFVFGIIIAIGFLHLGFFVARRERKSLLYFCIVCILILLRALTTSERYLLQLIPTMPWAFHYRLEYLSFYLIVPAFGYYLRSHFADEFTPVMMTVNSSISSFFVLIVLLFPVGVFSRSLVPFHVYTVFALIFGGANLIRAILAKRTGAIPIAIGFAIFVAAVANDILSSLGILDTMMITPIGLFIFIILQSTFLTIQYSRAFETIDRQRTELAQHREGLERLVEERTHELADAVDEAERANSAKSDFLAHMSHELRTPLNHIYGFSQLLADPKVGPLNGTQKEYLSDILHSGQHLLELIDRILDLTKVEAGRIELEYGDLSVGEIVDESVAMVKNRADEAGVHIRTVDLEELPRICGDRMRLKQVILNILDNALKFSPDGGEIVISSVLESLNSPTFSLQITDSGIGIDGAEFDKVFEPLEQIDPKRSGKYTGAGLGMALARRFIELHHGVLKVMSEGEGKGTTFEIVLPVGQPV